MSTLLVFIIICSSAACTSSSNLRENKLTDKTAVIIGNHPGNLINEGIVALQGDKLYYSNGGYEPIKRADLNGKVEMEYDYYGGRNINIADNWIYYIAVSEINGNEIIRMKTDGTDRTKLIEGDCNFLCVQDEHIYYTESDTGNLYRAKTDGSGITLLSEDNCSFVNIDGKSIYYCSASADNKVYKISDNKKTEIINDSALFLNMSGDWIYYINKSDDNKIYKANTDGKNKKMIVDNEVSNLNVYGDRMYYTVDEADIYISKTDGTDKERIAVDFKTSTPCLSILGDFIYYFSAADNYKVCRISATGNDKSVFK